MLLDSVCYYIVEKFCTYFIRIMISCCVCVCAILVLLWYQYQSNSSFSECLKMCFLLAFFLKFEKTAVKILQMFGRIHQ